MLPGQKVPVLAGSLSGGTLKAVTLPGTINIVSNGTDFDLSYSAGITLINADPASNYDVLTIEIDKYRRIISINGVLVSSHVNTLAFNLIE